MRRAARPLLYAGLVGIVFGFSKLHAARIGDYDFTESARFSWALAFIALLALAAYGLGLPEVPKTLRSRLPTAVTAAGLGALGVSLVQLVVGAALLPRFVVFGSAIVAVPWLYLCSTIAGAGRRSDERRDAVVVVGPASLAAEIAAELEGEPERAASVVACLELAEAATDNGARPLADAVRRHGGSVLVLSAAAQADDRIVAEVARLHETGLRVRTQSLFYEEWLGKLPVADLGRVGLFFDIGEVHRTRFGRAKRIIDVGAGVVGVVALALAVPIVAVANVFGNRGSLFYTQDRVGRHGEVFTIYKFRSMRSDPSAATDWTTDHDPRVTRFGRVLRASHLDELPQVWNILMGDLSLVGPRPEQPRYVAELSDRLPFYDLRHIVRPGLTGWAQVKFGYAGDEKDALQKLQYDFHYLRRQSLGFDLRIIARTARAIVGSQGRGR